MEGLISVIAAQLSDMQDILGLWPLAAKTISTASRKQYKCDSSILLATTVWLSDGNDSGVPAGYVCVWLQVAK